jgi:hypothetical protein
MCYQYDVTIAGTKNSEPERMVIIVHAMTKDGARDEALDEAAKYGVTSCNIHKIVNRGISNGFQWLPAKQHSYEDKKLRAKQPRTTGKKARKAALTVS